MVIDTVPHNDIWHSSQLSVLHAHLHPFAPTTMSIRETNLRGKENAPCSQISLNSATQVISGFDSLRLAPRLSSQFRVGPPFGDSTNYLSITCTSKRSKGSYLKIQPKVSARLDRGFDLINGEWIGYKRNYFTLVAAYSLAPLTFTESLSHQFFLTTKNQQDLRIHRFRVCLTSHCAEDECSPISLIQHTAKRDRGPQFTPPAHDAVPGELPKHDLMRLVANIRNGDKISQCRQLFFMTKEEVAGISSDGILAYYESGVDIARVARYERVQFLSSGAGTRKLASTNNKHYLLVVKLTAVTEDGEEHILASTKTPPLVIRGRLPSNYITRPLENDENEDAKPQPKRGRVMPLGQSQRINIERIGTSKLPKVFKDTQSEAPSAFDPQLFEQLRGEDDANEARGDVMDPLPASQVQTPKKSSCCSNGSVMLVVQESPMDSLSEILWPDSLNMEAFSDEQLPLFSETFRFNLELQLSRDCSKYYSFPVPVTFPNSVGLPAPLQIEQLKQPRARTCLRTVLCKHGNKRRQRKYRRSGFKEEGSNLETLVNKLAQIREGIRATSLSPLTAFSQDLGSDQNLKDNQT